MGPTVDVLIQQVGRGGPRIYTVSFVMWSTRVLPLILVVPDSYWELLNDTEIGCLLQPAQLFSLDQSLSGPRCFTFPSERSATPTPEAKATVEDPFY